MGLWTAQPDEHAEFGLLATPPDECTCCNVPLGKYFPALNSIDIDIASQFALCPRCHSDSGATFSDDGWSLFSIDRITTRYERVW